VSRYEIYFSINYTIKILKCERNSTIDCGCFLDLHNFNSTIRKKIAPIHALHAFYSCHQSSYLFFIKCINKPTWIYWINMHKCLKIISRYKKIELNNFLKVFWRNKFLYNFLMVYLIFNELCGEKIGVSILYFCQFSYTFSGIEIKIYIYNTINIDI